MKRPLLRRRHSFGAADLIQQHVEHPDTHQMNCQLRGGSAALDERALDI